MAILTVVNVTAAGNFVDDFDLRYLEEPSSIRVLSTVHSSAKMAKKLDEALKDSASGSGYVQHGTLVQTDFMGIRHYSSVSRALGFDPFVSKQVDAETNLFSLAQDFLSLPVRSTVATGFRELSSSAMSRANIMHVALKDGRADWIEAGTSSCPFDEFVRDLSETPDSEVFFKAGPFTYHYQGTEVEVKPLTAVGQSTVTAYLVLKELS